MEQGILFQGILSQGRDWNIKCFSCVPGTPKVTPQVTGMHGCGLLGIPRSIATFFSF